ncbi:MAG: hypothetical protein JW957_06800 [Candidatus Omnitrophica bacterium]|nr:hypothetical protein [Candidatus Omnitrophota bacterium]
MTGRERIMAVLRGGMPDRVPVSLYKINPFESDIFWAKHKSFEKLLQAAKEYQDTFHPYRPKTGFFFSAPGSIEVKAEEFQDTPLSRTVKLSVATGKGHLTKSVRTSNTSMHQWVQKPWIENERDISKFLALPYTPFNPDLSDYYRINSSLGDNGIVVIALPDPLAVVAELFAPGDMPQFMMSMPREMHQLLENMQERLVNLYRFISTSVSNTLIRIRGAEYGVPPELPVEYFRDTKKVFSDFVLKYDRELIDILKRGNKNFICYHWHGDIEQLLPAVLKLGIDILEPVVNSVGSPAQILKIRRIAGEKVILMGGPFAEDMEYRSSGEISSIVKESIIQGGRRGAFILIPSNIPESSPISSQMEGNYIEFLKAGVTYGKYPIA